ncbi:MAG: zinc ribbon domain-containing protein [Candidatus Omnitrophota bacterium]
MPTYDYECKKCNKVFEISQSIKAAPIKKCPKCGSNVKRLISPGAGFILKGSGFYATDHRSKSYKEKQKKEQQKDAPVCPKTGKQEGCSGCKG